MNLLCGVHQREPVSVVIISPALAEGVQGVTPLRADADDSAGKTCDVAEMLRSALISASLLMLLTAATPPGADSCDLRKVTSQGELQFMLSRRAVEALGLAKRGDLASMTRLRKLVDPDATVDLGAGDVGSSLGTGESGLRTLVQTMQADTFRFQKWTWIPTPAQSPCGLQEVTVEFTAANGTNSYPMKFTFVGGRITSAKGWTNNFEVGPMP